ncbi:MAG TPA: GNAT family N-acetyltransferase [Gaiellaceae bacterium]|nr:GNAT family N-acetyltransferase [Gaiellaceae bacterium]
MRSWTRPDGRCFVFGEPDGGGLPPGRVYATADEEDEPRMRALTELGFAVLRRELVLQLPTDRAAWTLRTVDPPPGIVFVPADRVPEERLRALDDLLRQDVPGTDGWRWSSEGFREETYESSDFDPATYLVALDERGEGIGIARVWMRPEQPRLGLIGVRSDWRRRGVARALLAAALGTLRERGLAEVRTEVDEANAASRELLLAFGARVVGASLELVREATRRSAEASAQPARREPAASTKVRAPADRPDSRGA